MSAINHSRNVGRISIRTFFIVILSALALAACGGGEGSSAGSSASSSSTVSYSIGGSVSGLDGSVTLRNNGVDDLVIGASGAFLFATRLAGGVSYNISIASQPAHQNCTIANGTGAVSNADVSNVAVTCITPGDVVISGMSPTHGRWNELVTLNGSGFSATPSDNVVTLNNRLAEVQSATATELQVLVPRYAGSGNFQISVQSSTAQSPLFTYDLTSVLVSTVAGKGFGYQDGPIADATFWSISDLAVDTNGAIFVADGQNHAVRTVNSVAVGTLAGGITAGFNDGAGSEAQFETPAGLAFDSSGNLYVSDCGEAPCGNGNIRKITPAGIVTTYWGGTGAGAGNDIFMGLAFGPGDTLYVADYGHHRILQIDPPSSGGAITTLAGSGVAGAADGAGSAAQFQLPTGVAYCPNDGNLYVADSYNMEIRKVTTAVGTNPGGQVTTYAGSNAGGLSFVDGDLETARFLFPERLSCDLYGTLFVTDSGNNRIRMITPSGVVSTLAGGFPAGDADGDAVTAQFRALGPIAIGGDGVLLVGDSSRIRKIVWE